VIHPHNLKENTDIYLFSVTPITLKRLRIIKIISDGDNISLKLMDEDLTFDTSYTDTFAKDIFYNKAEAEALLHKTILLHLNTYLEHISDKKYNNYYQLDEDITKSKTLFPELFI